MTVLSVRSAPDQGSDRGLARLLTPVLGRAVRTPLHSLLGFLELLAMTDLDADQRRLLDQLVDSSEDLLGASDRMLWLLRLLDHDGRGPGRDSSRGYVPVPGDLDVAALLAEVAADRAGLHTAPGAPARITTDRAALHQLLLELVDNAVAHGASPVTVTAAAGPSAGFPLRVTVSDRGAGLPPASRALLLAGEPTDALVAPGWAPGAPGAPGLGLHLVHRLAGLLGVTVEVSSGSTGTQVSLLVPTLSSAPASRGASCTGDDASSRVTAPGSPAPTRVVPPRALRVLLVEDNATNRLLARRQLQRLGHSLVEAVTGEQGVRAALAGDVDVVLMDRHLPDIDGCEATRRIRAALADGTGGAHLPILAVTADATTESRDACLDAGMDEVLTKPVDLAQLGAALARTASAARAGSADGAAEADPRGAAVRAPAVLRAIRALADDDPVVTAQIVQTYLGELPGRRLRIAATLRRDDPQPAARAADSLRTSSETVGAGTIAGVCAAIAASAAAGDLGTARALLPSLARHCEQLHAELVPFTDVDVVVSATA